MRLISNKDSVVGIEITVDELLTLRHCVVEALEALGETEFRIRVGAPRLEAERLLAELKEATRTSPPGMTRPGT